MKKLAAILCLGALTTGAFAQGLVAFANGPTTLISLTPAVGSPAAISASPVGSYYFALLTAATAAGPFTLNTPAIYATNTAAGSKLGPGTYTPAVAGWAPGATMFYEVAGWSASLGTTYNPAWATLASNKFPANGFFGMSGIASGAAGGGSPPAPALPLFGGTGLAGFSLGTVTTGVPEPTSMALAGLGAAALLIFRRRK